jgi:hypothetical protein
VSGVGAATRLRYDACRRAAAAVRGAEYGQAAARVLRPRGVGGLVRSRPPLGLLLWLSAVQGLVVWSAPKEFVLLEPPGGGAGRRRVGSRWAALCGAADRWWELLVFASVPLAGLVSAAVLALAGYPMAALVLVLAAVAWTAVWLVAVVLRAGLFLYMSFERSPRRSPDLARSALRPHWRLALVQVEDPRRVHRLIDGALRQVDDLAATAADRSVEDEAGVVCALSSVTTAAARAVVLAAGRVEELPGPEPTVVVVLREAEQRSEPPTVGGAGISAILLGLVTTMAVLPMFAAESERQACGGGPACEGRPTSYGAALSWLLGRLAPFGGDDAVRAESMQAKVLGWLTVALGVVVAVCVVIAVQRMGALSRSEREAAHRQISGQGLAPPPGKTAPVTRRTDPANPDVFINYRKEDGGWAVAVQHYLSDAFDGVFRDSRDIRAGQDIEHLFGCGTLVVSGRDGRGRLELPSMPNVSVVGSTLYQLAHGIR